ncbi:hypothetical protein AQUCO_04700118v1 [Aquilegia coerulea]|uniref:Sugar phosphate transporter domain-containing protein n=1 Tax=Aquilegia coerulea TaxID=218851 RepID=A0A2G5CL32_AQUCA|nr:hypothetical protein AQUCO_04700118v1 [Aquilegia coerulea]
MFCSLKQSGLTSSTFSNPLIEKTQALKHQRSLLFSLSKPPIKGVNLVVCKSFKSSAKPLYISSIKELGSSFKLRNRGNVIECKAHEDESIETKSSAAAAAAQKVAVAHTIGHVAATVSMANVAVSFTHIIKSGEPACSVLVSRFLLGETFPTGVYLSLIPIIGGCALSALTELNFNMTGFNGAMISNLAFVFRNIFSKRGMKGKSISGMNYYACLSIMSFLILTPFAIAVEGPQMWAAGWQNALSQIGPNFLWWVAAQSLCYHLYNQFSYMSLDEISPLTFSIGNTMKRISVIVSTIIIFRTPVQPINALGAAIAIFGTFLYSQAKQ